MPTLEFFGLCGLLKLDNVFQASMPKVASHRAVLCVPAEDLVIDKSSEPEFIVHDGAGKQLAGWTLDTARLAFYGASGTPDFDDPERAKLLDLREFHGGETMKASGAAAVIELPRGSVTAGTNSENFEILFGGGTVVPNEALRISAVWTGTFDTLQSQTGKPMVIVLQETGKATISNLAPAMHGDHHFVHCYYEFFKNKPNKFVSIKNLHRMHPPRNEKERRNVEVFDCVPPVPLP